MSEYQLITDGAYSSKLDQGGVGILFLKDGFPILEYSRMYKHTTNNQMELAALIIGLSCIVSSINKLVIITDSMYCIGCASKGWKRKKNKELWNKFDEQFKRVSELCPDIQFQHVKGHQKDDSVLTKWNNYVDELAVKASLAV